MNYYAVDDEKARKKAAAKATDEVRKSFPQDPSSDAANTLWLEVFWREYKRMVSP